MTSPIDKSAAEANIKILPIMTLREVVIFPHAIMPLFVGRESSIKAIEQAISSYGKHIFLVTQKEADVEKPQPEDIYTIGVVSRILQLMRLPDGSIKVLFEGLYRATWEAFSKENEHLDFATNYNITKTVALEAEEKRNQSIDKNEKSDDVPSIDTALSKEDFSAQTVSKNDVQSLSNPYGTKPYPCLITTQIEEFETNPQDAEALYRAVHEAMEEFAKINRKISPEHVAAIAGLHNSGRLADAIMPHLRIEYAKKQEALEILNTADRLEKAYELLNGELAVASLEKKIKGRVKDQMERNQREYYLTEQVKAIHKEMGSDDPHAEADELEALINAKKDRKSVV